MFIFKLINKNTKTLLLKQKIYTRLSILFYCKSKEKIIYYAFYYQDFVFEQANNTFLKLFVKTFLTRRYIFFRNNVVK
jgi:hypothetical protein